MVQDCVSFAVRAIGVRCVSGEVVRDGYPLSSSCHDIIPCLVSCVLCLEGL